MFFSQPNFLGLTFYISLAQVGRKSVGLKHELITSFKEVHL